MIDRDDLKAAIGAGIVTEAQAASLASLADSRRGARENLGHGDEPFELFKGFNEVFIVIGLIILAVGAIGAAGFWYTSQIIGPRQAALPLGALAVASLWILSEYFIRKRRMVAPAITLSVMFAGTVALAFSAYFSEPFMIARQDYSSLPLPFALGTAALFLYWLRFRVPFALAMIALGLFAVAILMAAATQGALQSPADLFLLSADGPFALITISLGIGVFIAAMFFDMSDPHRVTRRSANGFWLHVVAAPALINTIALTLLDRDTSGANTTLIIILSIFALIAIIIDRRSFLIAAIGYIVVLSTAIFDGESAAFTILGLGIALLLLGAFWERIRATILGVMPFLPLHKLPPTNRVVS